MYVADAVKVYGTLDAVARVLGISRVAVRKWDKVVPAESAIRLSEKSGGALKIEPGAYERLATKRYKSLHPASKRASTALSG